MDTCPICGGDSTFAFVERNHQVHRCEGVCGHLFSTTPGVDRGVQTHDATEEAQTYRARNDRLMAYLLREGVYRPGDRILDFGAGAGHVAEALARTGAEVTCLEADPESRRHLVDLGFDVADSLDHVARASCDAALLIEVIEHVEDPVGVLREVASILRPGGHMFLTTPCGETPRGSRATNAYETPEHIQFFTERSLTEALRRGGFGPPSFRTVNALYPRPPGARHAALARAKGALRPVRARLLGHTHLVLVADRDGRAGAPGA